MLWVKGAYKKMSIIVEYFDPILMDLGKGNVVGFVINKE
jgi:hypothetical protein